ncbi:MAG TPA: hypothetical protein VK853_00645 [Ilumatobacteraceae bacterium]|nr:hypothetical protein [Ilumatobacteraceae bacterium]
MLSVFLNENQTLVRIMYLIHIVTVIGAFGPLFLYPRLQRAGQSAAVAGLHMKLVFPSLVILWVAGMGMAGINRFDLAQTYWITITIVLWLVALVVSWFMIRPALTDTSDAARSKMAAGIGITHVVLVLSLWLMIFKPFVDTVYVFNE